MDILEIDTFTAFLFAAVGATAAYLLNLHNKSEVPKLVYSPSKFNEEILTYCDLLTKEYVPTLLWGKSGHVQTILYGKMGRVNSPFPLGDRHSIIMSDGATMTFDIFKPLSETDKNCILMVCPGIANSSESVYIRTYIDFAQRQGYTLAVLNHLGAVKSITLTSPRLYTYGDTEEYNLMVKEVEKMYPNHRFIAVGFSLGANVIVKYLGEEPSRQRRFVGAISSCQGYDILSLCPMMTDWRQLRRLYIYAMTRHQQGILRRCQNVLFSEEAEKKYGKFDLKALMRATTLHQIDELYSHKRAGFKTCEEYYKWASSASYIDKVKIPMLLLNAADDPIVPEEVHYIPRKVATEHHNVIFALTAHGGHLGYFEGGIIIPNTITWLDKVVISYSDALLRVISSMVVNEESAIPNLVA